MVQIRVSSQVLAALAVGLAAWSSVAFAQTPRRGNAEFRYPPGMPQSIVEAIVEADRFLASLGYLQGEPAIRGGLSTLEGAREPTAQ